MFKWIIWISLIVLGIVVIYNTMNTLNNKEKKEAYEDKPVTVALFHATWCGHCVNYLKTSTFDDAAAESPQVSFTKYEADSSKKLIEKYDITSFPTIIGIGADGNKIADFKGSRDSKQDLIDFAKSLQK